MTLLCLTLLSACSTSSTANRTTFIYPDKQPSADTRDYIVDLSNNGDLLDDRNRIKGQRNRCAAQVGAFNSAIDKIKALEAKQKAEEKK